MARVYDIEVPKQGQWGLCNGQGGLGSSRYAVRIIRNHHELGEGSWA